MESSDKYIPFGTPVVPLEYIKAHGRVLLTDLDGCLKKCSDDSTMFE